MEQNLIIHVNGPLSSNCNVYLTNLEFTNWQRIGLIQNIRFEASADDAFLTELSVGMFGLSIDDVEVPNIIDGTIIYLRNFSSINERFDKDKNVSKPIILPDVLILEGQKTIESLDVPFYELHRPISMIKRIVLEVDVKTNKSNLEIQKVEGF